MISIDSYPPSTTNTSSSGTNSSSVGNQSCASSANKHKNNINQPTAKGTAYSAERKASDASNNNIEEDIVSVKNNNNNISSSNNNSSGQSSSSKKKNKKKSSNNSVSKVVPLERPQDAENNMDDTSSSDQTQQRQPTFSKESTPNISHKGQKSSSPTDQSATATPPVTQQTQPEPQTSTSSSSCQKEYPQSNKKQLHQPPQDLHPIAQTNNNDEDSSDLLQKESFLLIDENEFMQVNSVEEFANRLGCSIENSLKVVSIFGSIGHGKSYTLNQTFYDCHEVFQTSSSQESCTIGIWAAYDPTRRVITLDTEGLLGVSANCQRRTRLLLKVLAISDIVIYRTRSERLEDNLFTFLGDASRVYVQHFFKEIKNAFQRLPEFNGHPISELGPVVIIFQETRDTEPLKHEPNRTRESIIRSRFKTLGLTTEAFSAIEYVGIQTLVRPTNFDTLKSCIKRHIKNSSTRTPRSLTIIYKTLYILNEKFNGDIEQTVPSMFPNQYLTCPTTCLSCNARCINSMNHLRDGLGHHTETKCIYQHQFNNHILFCRACYERGEEIVVTPKTCSSNESPWIGLAKYAWAGYVLECPRCGIIHRSRQYWFGNKDTWESAVRTEIKHVWPGELNKMQAAQNAAQRVLDSVNYITETVSSISAKPTKMVSEWVADQIAPNYWIPNSRILHCALCNNEFGQFDQKHHCRLCGNGLCSTCSSKSKPVPERGWGETSVRVCDRCYERSDNLSAISSLPPLPPMLVQQTITTGNSSSSVNTNGFYPKSASVNDFQLHKSTSSTSAKNKIQNHQNPSSHFIPIPANRGACSNSSNTTPTPYSSSSIGSSSTGSNNSNNQQQFINDVNNSPTNNKQVDNFDDFDNHKPESNSNNKPTIEFEAEYPTMMVSTSSAASHPPQSTSGSFTQLNGIDSASTITARKFGEVIQSTIKTVVSTAIDYPLGVIKDSARPEYWLPDSQITNCGLCKKDFNELITIHHCRRCGKGFCNDCSSKSMPVPERGWGDASVRVCDKCYNLK